MNALPSLFELLPKLELEILGTSEWQIHGGMWGPGLWGQVTHCRWGEELVWVREHIRGPHFQTNANARLALKEGRVPKSFREVLELAAPDAIWEEVAAAVREMDQRKRPVLRSTLWTPRAAVELIEWRKRCVQAEAGRPSIIVGWR